MIEKLTAVLAVALLATGCGPTDAEIGAHILAAGPAMVAVGLLLQWIYRLVWKMAGVDVSFRIGPSVVAMIVTTVLALFANGLVESRFDSELAVICLWAAGATYAVFLLLGSRIFLQRHRGFEHAMVIAWLAIIIPSFVFAAMSPFEVDTDLIVLLALPGYAGIGTGFVALVLGIEVGVRIARHRRAQRVELARATIVSGT